MPPQRSSVRDFLIGYLFRPIRVDTRAIDMLITFPVEGVLSAPLPQGVQVGTLPADRRELRLDLEQRKHGSNRRYAGSTGGGAERFGYQARKYRYCWTLLPWALRLQYINNYFQ